MCCTHGRPHLLEEAVESFLLQDYPGSKELLVLNDQPEQELVFKHPQVRIINVGKSFRSLGEKRNACAALCTNDWLFVWDDDDIYLPWRISWSMQMVKAGPGFFKPDRSLMLSDGVLSGPEDNLFHSSACFHRDLFDRAGGYPPMGTGEDLEFERKIAKSLGVRSLAFAGSPHDKLFYIYRWEGTDSYHVSWFDGGAEGHAQVLDHVTDAIRAGRLPAGRILLEPNWKADYVDKVGSFLSSVFPAGSFPATSASPASEDARKSPQQWSFHTAAAHARSIGISVIGEWLLHCADPLGSHAPAPLRLLLPKDAKTFVAQADSHGVLPVVLGRFPPFVGNDPAFAEAKAMAQALHRSAVAQALMLRTNGEAVIASAGAPAVIVKGPVFARTIYPAPNLRTFTDVDILVAPEGEPTLARVLSEAGFQSAEYERDPARQEWKWVHRENDAVMIEVHTNLVHHPHLRAVMSIGFADLAGVAETPAALLTVAATHGALHRFEQLRQVVDICQAARHVRTVEEEARLAQLVDRTRTRFAAVVALDLAYRLLDEPRCRELALGLGPVPRMNLSRMLLGRSVIASTMGETRYLHSWRRQAFRFLLKHSSLSPD